MTEDIQASLKGQLRGILKPELLVEVHNIRFPWPKGAKIDWQDVVDNLWEDKPDVDRALYELIFPVWLAMSKLPIEELKKIDMLEFVDGPNAPEYPEQCTGLIYIFDQTRCFFRGTDIRYTPGFFDPLAEATAAKLFDDQSGGNGVPSAKSPFSKEAWMSRGWTFEDYAARMDWIWAALIHSELYMSKYRTLNQGFLHRFRAEVERYTGKKDPYAETEAEDEKDLMLFSNINKGYAPSKKQLGRDLDIMDYVSWMLRMMTAHFPIIDRFGRYPYGNDVVGRDFAKGEWQWMQSTGSFQRVPEDWRVPIRKDVDEGMWTPMKGNPPKHDE